MQVQSRGQSRFAGALCHLADHLFSGPGGVAAVASSRPNTALAKLCGRMESILLVGGAELEKFTKSNFIIFLFKGSKLQETFENLDRDMTQCLNELSVALHVTTLSEQAQIYEYSGQGGRARWSGGFIS